MIAISQKLPLYSLAKFTACKLDFVDTLTPPFRLRYSCFLSASVEYSFLRPAPCLCPPWSWHGVWTALAGELCRPASEPRHLHDLACHLALASTLPEAGIPNAAERAMQALRDLAASGFDNPPLLREDGRLAPLRDREDYQDLLRRLQVRAGETPAAARDPGPTKFAPRRTESTKP